jgi:hypothetical protein
MTNPVISAKRIETIRELLLATGWSDDGTGGYLAPELIRDEVALQYGRGHLHLWDAINAQTRFDSFVVHEFGVAA